MTTLRTMLLIVPDKALKFGAYYFQLNLTDARTFLGYFIYFVLYELELACLFGQPVYLSLLDSWLQSNHNFPDSSRVDWAEWFE